MKKGNTAPRVRARWVSGYYPHYTDYQLPTWCAPWDFFAVIIIEILGLPFPAEVHAEDCYPAKWNYVPSEGAVIWRGTFNTGLISGEWTYKQGIDNVAQSYNRFSLTHNDGLANPRVIYESVNPGPSGDWNGAHPRNIGVSHRLPGVTPWVGVSDVYFQFKTYAEIRFGGENPDDTSPLTWTDNGLP